MAGRGPRGVHKFGGTSVQSAEAMQQVRQIITGIAAELGDGSPLAVVVSAMGGKPKVTDLLIETVSLAAAGELDAAKAILAQIRAKHEAAMGELFVEPVHAAEAATLARELHADLADIEHLLRAVSLMRAKDQRLVGVISGYGEQWSARMMAALLRCTRTPPAAANWVYLDARSVLVVDESISTGVAIIWDESARRLDAFVRAHAGASMVITGFIASTRDGGITTLGRDGSDYSASVFGRLFEAESVTIWTDVSGVLSADPRVVADAYVLPEVSYNEAAELAHFGAKVVHPKTMQPALARLDWRPDARSIPIHIRNTFAPRDRGTRIYETSPLTTSREVCGVSAMDGMCLVNVMGRGMVGIPGVASRLFNALHSLGVNVTAIAQASSEQSISVALQQTDGGRAQAAVREVFRHELHAGHIEDVQLVPDVTIIAVVGDGMSRSPGVAGKVMSALGQAGVNIRAIAQGCNETNITTIVDGRQSLRALRAVHSAFLASLTVAVGVVARSGPVASELLCSFERHGPTAQARFGLNAQVLALCKLAEAGEAPAQRGRLLARDQQAAPDLSAWARALADGDATGARADGDDAGAAADLAAFTEAMLAADVPMRVVIDASDSALAARWHREWLAKGIHVITNNSAALTGDSAEYAKLCAARRASVARYVYGTAYGDWLPVASTVTTLLASGDALQLVEGVLSASVSHVLNALAPDAAAAARADGGGTLAFSKAVRAAYELGLFEADPLDDLSGAHSAKQCLCLARDLGYELELADIEVEPLVPARPAPLPTSAGRPPADGAEVEASMAPYDAEIAARIAGAASRGCVLRFLARLEHAEGARPRAVVRAEEVPLTHPLAALSGSAISVCFHSEESLQPLVISGAISQKSCVNALYSDLIRLARSLDTRARDRGHISAATAAKQS